MIEYKKGGSKKYVLTKMVCLRTKIKPKHHIFCDYARLFTNGYLVIFEGYQWDGPSGPAIDTDTFMRGSLVHDLLYELLRDGWFGDGFWERAKYRLYADNEMFRQCGKGSHKMMLPRRIWTWLGVRLGGFWSAR